MCTFFITSMIVLISVQDDAAVYVLQRMTYLIKRALCFITSMIVLISVQDDAAVYVLQRMTYLIKQDLQQTICLPVLQRKLIKRFIKTITIHQTCQTHSNFCIFKFHVLFNFIHQIIYEIKSHQNFTFITMKVSRSMVYELCVQANPQKHQLPSYLSSQPSQLAVCTIGP